MDLSQCMDLLDGMNLMIGMDGPITLNTGIYEHLYEPGYDPKGDLVTIGREGCKIRFRHIYRAFKLINTDNGYQKAFNCGRSYCFEGIRQDKKNPNMFRIGWGS